MKGESSQSTVEVDKEYGLEKYTKSEYASQLLKEFRKYGKKLIKIKLYEQMAKEGKPLAAEIKEMMTKKDEFEHYVKMLKLALDAHEKVEKPKATEKSKPKAEAKFDPTEMCSKLGQTIAILYTLKRRDAARPDPFQSSSIPTREQQAELLKLTQALIGVRESQDTSIAEEAKRISGLLFGLLRKDNEGIEGGKITYAQLADIVEKVMLTTAVRDMRFKTDEKQSHYHAPDQILRAAEAVHSRPAEPVKAPAVAEPVKAESWADEEDKGEEEEEGEEKEGGFTISKDKRELRASRAAEKEAVRASRRGRGGFRRGRGERRGRGSPRRGGFQPRDQPMEQSKEAAKPAQ